MLSGVVMRLLSSIALIILLSTSSASADYQSDQNEVCGYLPYRPAGESRFGPSREEALPAKIGGQATYALALDLLRPTFLAAEVADDLLAGRSIDEIKESAGSALSLGEYMLHSAKHFGDPPKQTEDADFRRQLAESRSKNFHSVYILSKNNYDAIVQEIMSKNGLNTKTLREISMSWRPAYALLAKAQADDKRIELLASDLDINGVLEKEAEVCLAHSVYLLAMDTPGAIDKAQRSIKRWDARPLVNARTLPKAARAPFFDREDVGDELATKVLKINSQSISIEDFKDLSKLYAEFVDTSKVLHNAMLEKEKRK